MQFRLKNSKMKKSGFQITKRFCLNCCLVRSDCMIFNDSVPQIAICKTCIDNLFESELNKRNTSQDTNASCGSTSNANTWQKFPGYDYENDYFDNSDEMCEK